MRVASELEVRRLSETFAALCAIPSPSRGEGAVAAYVRSELEQIGVAVVEDDAAEVIGGQSGNLLARIGERGGRSVLFCAHLDTVPHEGAIVPVFVNGGWESEGETILGADNKAAVAVFLELARRAKIEGAPVDLELCFTVAEEPGLLGANALDVSEFRSQLGYVYDHATPIGEIIAGSPTHIRWRADIRGRAAHAGISPEDGRSAITTAARAIATLPDGRLDDLTTTNVARIRGGVAGTNVVPEHCQVDGEVRSLEDGRAEIITERVTEAFQDAANEPDCQCDLDFTIERSFIGYRLGEDEPAVAAALAALEASGYEPKLVLSGGGSDANAFRAKGFPCVNLANGTQNPHQSSERVAGADLEAMLNVTFALIDELGEN
jgi:tripeptide aminopeptidase